MAGIRRALGSLLGPEGKTPQLVTGTTTQVSAGDPAEVTITKIGPGRYRMDSRVPKGLDGDPTAVADFGQAFASTVNSPGPGREALNAQVARPASSIELLSSTDRLADTKRLRITSSQKQEASNNWDGGESIWFDLENPLAKSMLTWRIQYDPVTREVYPEGTAPPGAPFRRVVWAGAHWFAQDQPDDDNPSVIHGHWSVETPNPDGSLHTRFQIFYNDRTDPTKVGSMVALISTNNADFMIDRQHLPDGSTSGRFILAGSHALDRMVEFSRVGDAVSSRRWAAGVTGQPETGANAGGNFAIRRHSDNGALLGTSLFAWRDTGRVTIGSEGLNPASDPSQLMVTGSGGAESGILVNPSTGYTSGAAFTARLRAWNDVLLRSKIGSGQPNFEVSAFGRLKWGDGASAPTTEMFIENGALVFIGRNGTKTTLAPA